MGPKKSQLMIMIEHGASKLLSAMSSFGPLELSA